MAGFRNIRAMVDADMDGANWTAFFHKTGGPALFGAGRWADMSMGAGIPKYNAYVGSQAAATVLAGTGNDGIYVGPATGANEQRHLAGMSIHSNSGTLAPATFLLCDYLLHYPLIDGDDTTDQVLDNSASLTRYTGGDGVRCMAICTTPMAANAITTLIYTNQAGVPGRSVTFSLLASGVVGCIVSSGDASGSAGSASPFIPLQGGDTGMRSIQSVTLSTGAGGFFALALVRPLAQCVVREAGVAVERDALMHSGTLPRIEAGAYLNFIYQPAGTGSAVTLRGSLDFVWG